jgi:hypothetical protein
MGKIPEEGWLAAKRGRRTVGEKKFAQALRLGLALIGRCIARPCCRGRARLGLAISP